MGASACPLLTAQQRRRSLYGRGGTGGLCGKVFLTASPVGHRILYREHLRKDLTGFEASKQEHNVFQSKRRTKTRKGPDTP